MDSHTANGRTRFPFISSEAFVSPLDKAALENLKKTPLLPLLVRKYNEFAADRIWWAQNAATSVRCTPKQFPSLYNLMLEACDILHIPEPELYMRYSESYNAYTAGMNRTFIVVQSPLVKDFSDEELLYIIGHEVGHIKCGHVMYQSVGQILLPLLEAIGQATLGLGELVGKGLVAGFFQWMREAEYSCDRAGTLVCQNPKAALSATMKLGSGSTRFDQEASLDAFLEQARNYAESGGLEGLAKVFQFAVYNWQLSHPQVVYRAKALDEWIRSGAYDRILSGEYARDVTGGGQLGQQARCGQCKKTVSATVQFCPECGNDLKPKSINAVTECSVCNTQLPVGTKYCANCGSAMNT